MNNWKSTPTAIQKRHRDGNGERIDLGRHKYEFGKRRYDLPDRRNPPIPRYFYSEGYEELFRKEEQRQLSKNLSANGSWNMGFKASRKRYEMSDDYCRSVSGATSAV